MVDTGISGLLASGATFVILGCTGAAGTYAVNKYVAPNLGSVQVEADIDICSNNKIREAPMIVFGDNVQIAGCAADLEDLLREKGATSTHRAISRQDEEKENLNSDKYFVGTLDRLVDLGEIREFDKSVETNYITRIEGKLDDTELRAGTYNVRLNSPTSENISTIKIDENGDILEGDEENLLRYRNGQTDTVYLIRDEAEGVTSSNPFIERIDEVYVFGAGTGNETNLVGIVGYDGNRLYETSFVADELRDSLNNLRKTDTTLENGLCDALIYAGEQPNILAGTRLFESTLADSRTENRVLGGKGNEFDYVEDGHLNLTGTCDDVPYETLRAGAISLGAAQAGNEQKINGAMLPNGRLETLLEMVPYHQTGDLNKDIENTILAAYGIVRSNGAVVGNGRTY